MEKSEANPEGPRCMKAEKTETGRQSSREGKVGESQKLKDRHPPQLGKRKLVVPPPAQDPNFEDKINLAKTTLNLTGSVLDPILKKVKQRRRKKLRNLETQLETVQKKTLELGDSVLDHPTFDKRIVTLQPQILQKIKDIKECDQFEKYKEELQAHHAAAIQKKRPNAEQLAQDAEDIMNTLREKRPASLDPVDSSKRDSLKGAELHAAFSFYDDFVKRLAVCLGRNPHVCMACWSILFTDETVVTDQQSKLRRKIACSEVFKDPSMGLNHARTTVEAWVAVSKAMMATPEDKDPVKPNTFPNLILPKDEINHRCWDARNGAVHHSETVDYLKAIDTTLDPNKCLDVAKGIQKIPDDLGMLDFSESNYATSSKKAISLDLDDQAGIQGPREPKKQEGVDQLRDRLRRRIVPEVNPQPVALRDPAPAKKAKKPRKKPAKKASKAVSAREVPLNEVSRPSSPKSGPIQEQKPQALDRQDLKTGPEAWKAFNYVEDGVKYTKNLAQLDEAWLSK